MVARMCKGSGTTRSFAPGAPAPRSPRAPGCRWCSGTRRGGRARTQFPVLGSGAGVCAGRLPRAAPRLATASDIRDGEGATATPGPLHHGSRRAAERSRAARTRTPASRRGRKSKRIAWKRTRHRTRIAPRERFWVLHLLITAERFTHCTARRHRRRAAYRWRHLPKGIGWPRLAGTGQGFDTSDFS